MLSKTCTRCKVERPLEQFAKRRTARDGRDSQCKVCINEYHREAYRRLTMKGWKEDAPTSQQKLRKLILEAYGNKCTCCGETEERFLTIEHVNGGGRAHIRRTGNRHRMMLEIIHQGFPPAYSVLCWNCNSVQRYGAVCPHIKIDISSVLEGLAC